MALNVLRRTENIVLEEMEWMEDGRPARPAEVKALFKMSALSRKADTHQFVMW